MDERPWYRSTLGIVACISGIASIAFCLTYVIVVWGPVFSYPEPTITASDSIWEVNKQYNLIGENLDTVSQAQIIQGTASVPILLLPMSSTRLMVSVPESTKPGVYTLQVNQKDGNLRSLPITVEVISEATVGCPEGSIVFADLNWTSAQVQSRIAQIIIEEGYGCATDGISGRAEPLWDSLINGNIHVYIEVWLPNLQEQWDEAMEEGSAIPLGKSLDNSWQSTFVVPTYVIRGDRARAIDPMAPDLKTVRDLFRFYKKFPMSAGGSKAELIGCLKQWNCSGINTQQVKAYGLDGVIDVKQPESEAALLSSLRRAYRNGEPWLGYMWGPN